MEEYSGDLGEYSVNLGGTVSTFTENSIWKFVDNVAKIRVIVMGVKAGE